MYHSIENCFFKFKLKIKQIKFRENLRFAFVFLHEQVYQVQQMLLQKIELIIQKIFDVIKNVD
jgi:hypothetical protein